MTLRALITSCSAMALCALIGAAAPAQQVNAVPRAPADPSTPPSASQRVPQPRAPQEAPATASPAGGRSPLDRPVSLALTQARLDEAIEAIAARAGITIVYAEGVVPVDRRVTLKIDGTVRAALERVLAGTSVRAEVTNEGTVVLVKGERRVSADTVRGTIIGRVVDSAASAPIAGVEVYLRNTGHRATTNERGVFSLTRVPVGTYTLVARLLGYIPTTLEIAVADTQVARVELVLRNSPTRLTEIVTTATGERRRLELGNDIVLLRVDSIVKAEPVTSVTDLLEGRVPGMVLQRTSGAPGDPARIRLRGNSSPLLSNDPIVIVDGVRVYSEQSNERGANLAGSGPANFAAPSPLDYLDPRTIETIEVIKGPSAATLYGQDAASGVIVITTKKGQSGPARWTMSVEHGQTQMAGRYPDLLFSWGHPYADNTPVFCPVSNRRQDGTGSSACVADSIVRFQLLNDPALTVLDQGHRTATTVGVSGGSSALTYSVTGSYRDEVGLIALPEYEIGRYRDRRGTAPPDWMRRPQNLKQWSASSRVTARLGAGADVSLTANLSRTEQQRSTLEQQLGRLMSAYLDRATGIYYERSSAFGAIREIDEEEILTGYYERATAAATQFTNGVNVNWRPLSWLTASADAGLNVIQRSDEIFLPRGFGPGSLIEGRLRLGQGTSVVSTVNLRARAEAPLGHGFRFQLSAGANYTGQSINDLKGDARGLPEGTESLNGAAEIMALSQAETDLATFGWYVEPGISHKRFWFSTGLRLDGGSTFGSGLKLPSFPKLSFSYLVSDEPFFPAALRSVFNTLRLRAAYGQAGRQPGPADRLRLYGAREAVWVDGQAVDGTALEKLGNTRLRPERSKEFEWGIDADLLDDRFSLSFTGYRKTTTDAMLDVPVAPSVYGNGVTILQNIGVVRNTGFEAALTAQPVRTDLVTWGVQLSVSQQRNEVVELGPGVEPFYTVMETGGNSGIRVAPGYPLFGRWTKPILGYADVNGNGVLEEREVLVGDTLVYVGGTLPDYTASLHTTLSLFRGAVSLSASLLYQDGMTQRNEVARQLAPFTRGWNDPTASLAEQAATIDVTEYNWIQTVNTVRLNSLAVTYNLPSLLARQVGAKALSISVQGSNLGLWTNYRGVDPNVNARATGNNVTDSGVLPQPRTWQVRLNATY